MSLTAAAKRSRAIASLLAYQPSTGATDRPERVLATRTMEQAFDDAAFYRRHVIERRNREPHVRVKYAQLRAWFMSDDTGWPYSFAALCEYLGMEPTTLRAKALAIMPEHDITDVRLPKKCGVAEADWRNPRAPVSDRMWLWAHEQPGPWTVAELQVAIGISREESYAAVKWPAQTGRLRKVGRGMYEVAELQTRTNTPT